MGSLNNAINLYRTNDNINKNNLIKEAVNILYNTMIFLGNGREALQLFEIENNIKFNENEYFLIWQSANNRLKLNK